MLLLLQVLSKNLPLIYLTYICIHKKGSFFYFILYDIVQLYLACQTYLYLYLSANQV